MRQYRTAVFIGRFAPFHKGHLKTLEHGLELAEYVLILLGSAFRTRSTKNPLTWEERQSIILKSLPEEYRDRVTFAPLMDYPYSEARWNQEVQNVVYALTENRGVVLIGVEKDATSYYLNEFPMWAYSPATPSIVLSSTDIRTLMYADQPELIRPLMTCDEAYDELLRIWPKEVNEMWRYEEQYVVKYGEGPFFTVDAAVVQSGHILLVTRGEYGKGQLALPGGFLERDETAIDGMIRELREETGLKVPEKVLKGSIQRQQLFDCPTRSARARIITYAYSIQLNNSELLPRVKGSSDASHAQWVPLSAVKPERMFEDHYYIIANLHGLSI
jgi:bifunctional NMN adenylyltransferase/nudix hydrolase